MDDNLIVQKIEEYLKYAQDWAHSSEIANHINHNRITVGKYLDILQASGKVELKHVGKAKLWKQKTHVKKTILIADDESPIRKLIELTLGEQNYSFIEAKDGLEVLEQAQSRPDLILLDVMMPKMNGFEALKQLKKNPHLKHIPVIMISAKAQVEDKIKGLKLGVSEYIVKPFDPSELQSHVESILSDDLVENTLTNLPNISQTNRYISSLEGADNIYSITFHNYIEYLRQYGFKKSSETMKFFFKFLKKLLSDHSVEIFYCGHLHDSKIFIHTSKPFPAEFKVQVAQLIPFFYTADDYILDNGTYYALLNGKKVPALEIVLEKYAK